MSDSPTDAASPTRTLRAVTVRLAPLLMVLHFVTHLDRANLGIAKADISADLQLSATVFGLGGLAIPVPRPQPVSA